jgi:hypothetical protein
MIGKSGEKLPAPINYPYRLTYTINDTDAGDADVMSRTLAGCTSRYWAFISHNVILPHQGIDVMLRCLRNEERRKEHKVVAATMACVDQEDETPKTLEVRKGVLYVVPDGRGCREEEFAAWDVCDHAGYGPVVVFKTRLEKTAIAFDRDFGASGHWLDFSMQLHEENLRVVRVRQPGTQMHVGCVDNDYETALMPVGDAPLFFTKWKSICDRLVAEEDET